MDEQYGQALRRWRYEAEENPKVKHHWARDTPGFHPWRGERVGKCPGAPPAGPKLQTLEDLLAGGIPWYPPHGPVEYPLRIYFIYDGWLYRATPTNPGQSYHAFPEDPEKDNVPPAIKRAIRARARELGVEKRIERWLRK